jgi:hypothetical protein
MQDLKLQTFKNLQTGNIAQIVINTTDSGLCVYYYEACPQGLVKAGADHEDMWWASWTPKDSTNPTISTSDCPCLDDALEGLETAMEAELASQPWWSDITGM